MRLPVGPRAEQASVRRRFATAVATALVAAVGLVPSAGALEGHDHKVMGTITMAAADHVMPTDREGKTVTSLVTTATQVRSKPAVTVEQIPVGARVVVTATTDTNQTMRATTIEVGAAPAAAR